MQMAGASMNADATEHDGDWVMTPVTESGTDRGQGSALHTDGYTAATEQLEHTVISIRTHPQ